MSETPKPTTYDEADEITRTHQKEVASAVSRALTDHPAVVALQREDADMLDFYDQYDDTPEK